jgi:Rap1a immunity proteins
MIADGEHNMKVLSALFAAGLLALPFSAQAAEPINLRANTAGELAELCGANPREAGADAKINYCHGFAQGAVDVELRRAGDKKPFCFPNPAPRRSVTLTEFTNWVRAMPDHRSLNAIDGLFRFLAERFPCK